MPPKKTPRSKPLPADALAHMTAVLENIEQQNRATIEAVQGVERRLIERFDARFEKIELRLGALELAVRKNSEDIRKNSEDIRKNSEDIRKNSEDIAALKRSFERLNGILGADREENAIAALERRVAELERRLGAGQGH